MLVFEDRTGIGALLFALLEVRLVCGYLNRDVRLLLGSLVCLWTFVSDSGRSGIILSIGFRFLADKNSTRRRIIASEGMLFTPSALGDFSLLFCICLVYVPRMTELMLSQREERQVIWFRWV